MISTDNPLLSHRICLWICGPSKNDGKQVGSVFDRLNQLVAARLFPLAVRGVKFGIRMVRAMNDQSVWYAVRLDGP